MSSEPTASGPLAGIVVVSLEQAVAAPIATRHLADLGARVIKVERPGEGDFARHYDRAVGDTSAHFFWLNRNKESVALDLKRPGADEVLQRLIASADVLVQNLGPGAAERLWVDARSLLAKHPRIVAVDMSGYGSSGPYADRRAYDVLVQAEAASIAVTGRPGENAKPGIAIADIGAALRLQRGPRRAFREGADRHRGGDRRQPVRHDRRVDGLQHLPAGAARR